MLRGSNFRQLAAGALSRYGVFGLFRWSEMSSSSTIEWTDATWNPVTGCTKISRGCDFCYAEAFAERFRGVKDHHFGEGFDLTLRPERLQQPLAWKTSKVIFVNSMSDLFHKDIPRSFVDKVFDVMEQCNWHIFQVLTKRSTNLKRYINMRYAGAPCPQHIWLGVSVEDAQARSRIRHLQESAATTRFLSVEPLLDDLGELDLTGVHWVIVGGESGSRARPMQPDWARNVRDQCTAQAVPFFFKQWGKYGPDGVGRHKKKNGRLLDGVEYNEMPR
ncbi:MAG TPA: phage Gp37/Gp68 family protein [Allosphingosinicella sp.]